MADLILTFKLPEAKIAKASKGFLKLYPNDELKEDGTPKYTNQQWVKEQIRRIIIRDIHRGLQMIENEQNIIQYDNTIVTTELEK